MSLGSLNAYRDTYWSPTNGRIWELNTNYGDAWAEYRIGESIPVGISFWIFKLGFKKVFNLS